MLFTLRSFNINKRGKIKNTNQSTNQPINQSTNQPINQSTNQPINQLKPFNK
ncbi:PT domain-containing protein [Photobacterium sp. GB-72]|uniref:PT domain-containing protein n=1 Tax=Photobacterium sp. GB-72 TaxID=2022105 RepID=UPI003514D911